MSSSASQEFSKDGFLVRASVVNLQPELLRRARRLAGSHALAEDLVQDTVIRALRFEATFLANTNVRAWMHQILHSVFVTQCRRQKRERNALKKLGSDPCSWTHPDGPASTLGLSPNVEQALARLPIHYKTAVQLIDLEELTYKQASEHLNVPPGTLMSRLHRGRTMLSEELSGKGNRERELAA